MSVKISVVIPVYNDEEYLAQTLRCWTEQSFKDIEIILVNDASTDGTAEIMEAWAQKDDRIRAFTLAQNSGTWVARNFGVEKATGEYIMFCDADDGIVPDACEILYNEMQRDPVDILHFGMRIINSGHLPENTIESMRKFTAPYPNKLRGRDVFLKCFSQKVFTWSLCNKIFRADLCKKALSGRPKMRLTYGEDAFAFFLITFFAKSYRGYTKKPLYQYYYGRGGTGKSVINIKQFRTVCEPAIITKEMRAFLDTENADDDYYDALNLFEADHLRGCVNNWVNLVSQPDKSACLDIMLDAWQAEKVVTSLASRKDIDRYVLAEQLKMTDRMRFRPRPIRTIATYYHSIVNGGIERVISALCALWTQMGYRVVLIYEKSNSEEEYTFPEEIKRVILPRFAKSEGKDYQERAKILRKCIMENNVDAVVYNAWTMNLALWDEMVIKASGAAFILYCHSIFSVELLRPTIGLKNLAAPPRLADAVLVLSETDLTFWNHFNNNVFQVNNPFTGNLAEWSTSSCDGHNILWLARISEVKRPFDTLAILHFVLQMVPDAKLHIVGSAKDSTYGTKFRRAATEMGLSKHVILHGFQINVMPYYQKASLFLITSEYEGYLLTLQESMAAGLPTVMYALPHLTLVQDNPGIISVPQGDTHAAAEAIAALLLDDDRRKQMGQQAREYIEHLMDYDYEGTWRSIFDSLGQPHPQAVSEAERLMMETLVLHQDIGLQSRKDAMRYGGRKTVRTAIKIVKAKDMLHEQGLRHVMKKGTKKLKDCTRDNGLKYTLRKIKEKLFG